MTSVFPCALGSEIKVIANSSVKTDVISKREIKRIFLEENSSLDDGSHAQPVLEKDGSVHEAFLREFMGRTDDDLQSFYRALVFTGRGSLPKQLNSDAEVVAYVARTTGAIGYVSSETSTEGVKTLAIAQEGNDSQRRLISRIEPDYPETLRRLNIGGTVRLEIIISAKGSVENVQLLGGIQSWPRLPQMPLSAGSIAAAIRAQRRKSSFPSTRIASWLFPCSRYLRARIIPALGADRHLSVPFGLCFYSNLTEAAGPLGICRLISDGVLIPDVMRYLPADLIHFVQRLGKKRQPARALRDKLERPPGTLRMLFIP